MLTFFAKNLRISKIYITFAAEIKNNKIMEIRQDIKDFVKVLQDSGIIAKVELSQEQYAQIQAICDMHEDEVSANAQNRTIVMIHSEYTDWIETYNK